jgi:hypothetical protein
MAIGFWLLVSNKLIFIGQLFPPSTPAFLCQCFSQSYKKSSVQVGLRDLPIQNLKELGTSVAKIKEKTGECSAP